MYSYSTFMNLLGCFLKTKPRNPSPVPMMKVAVEKPATQVVASLTKNRATGENFRGRAVKKPSQVISHLHFSDID